MVIKPNIYQKIVIILISYVYFTGIAWASVEIILGSLLDEIVVCLFFVCSDIFITVYLLIYIAAIGRTYRYSKQGCTISFLFYRKSYVWEELQIKKYEKDFAFTVGAGGGTSYGAADGVFFSVKPYKYTKSGSPITSSEIFQPSKFYVLFPHRMKKYSFIPYPVADRDKFLGLLKEWGVEIEGLE